MEKPVIYALDDDQEVVRAVARDLRQAYGANYRIVSSDSPEKSLDAAKRLKGTNGVVALFLVDQRMPHMNGVEFLEATQTLYPEAKRVLLTAYADTEAAIRAINRVKLDYYLMKPWHPPELNFYPVLDDLLGEWSRGFRPPFEGVRLIDHRWSQAGHHLRDFMARNHVPYQWLDVEHDPEAAALLALAGGATLELPLAIFPDGTRLARPTAAEIAARAGLTTKSAASFHDLLIVGGGPAGLAAAVYGASEGLRCAIVEQDAPGGQAGTSSRIENYLGFPAGVSGGDLARRALTQAQRFGAEMVLTQSVGALRVEGPYKILTLADGSELSSHALLVASGVTYRMLDTPGLAPLTGAGVYYGAAMTEATGCTGQNVYVVGGGNSAGQGAMFLSKYARSVTILIRGTGLTATMSQYLIDQITATPNIGVRPCTQVAAARGDGHLEAIDLHDASTGVVTATPADALFIYIGAEPCAGWLGDSVARDARGFVLTGSDLPRQGARPARWPLERDPFLLETNVPGIFAAGDVRANSVKRVAAAVGEGSTTVQFVHRYLAAR